MKTRDQQPSQRMQADRAELATRIGRAVTKDGRIEVQPGLYVNRVSVTNEAVFGVLEPSFCVIAQGSKEITLGDERFRYDPAHYLITTMNGLPATGRVTRASRDEPYLGLRLILDPSLVTAVMVEHGVAHVRASGSSVAGVDVSPLDADLLDAALRLVRLTERPADYRALAPLVIREIIYRLLHGAQADRLRHVATFGGQVHRMARAVQTLRDNFDKPLRVEDVAATLGMSVSGFHAHFKAVTAMSPLQFQKQLRLQEARRLMLSENLDAGEAGYRVGYEDQSHFSREYKRQFGEPPIRDVERLRADAQRELADNRTIARAASRRQLASVG
jgi:AraC-like DNA-binding protein